MNRLQGFDIGKENIGLLLSKKTLRQKYFESPNAKTSHNKDNFIKSSEKKRKGDIFQMLKENLILRNKVDLKVCRVNNFAYGRKAGKRLIEYVDDFQLEGNKKQRKKKMLFFTH